MDSPHLARGQLLIAQNRWELAEQELRLALVDDPNDSRCHALLAQCLREREKFDEATREAQLAVHLAPENPYPHYVLSTVLYDRNHYPEAEAAIRESLRLDPFDPDYFGWLAQVCYAQRRWPDALQAAEMGLALDGQHVGCVNVRSLALVKLGRKDDADASIRAALERNPENAYTHANLGWALLEKRQPEQALEHFREALRLDPQLEWARSGIVEAMKARYFVYRLMLMFFLWMMKLSRRGQWWVMLGGYFGYRFLGQLADHNAALRPWLQPILIAYIVFAVMTWLASPLFNLVLRLNRFGRLALSREEIRTSDWVGASLAGGLALLAGYWAFDLDYLLPAALMCGLMSFPLSRIYDCDEGWPRTTLMLCTAGMGLILLGSLGLMAAGEHLVPPPKNSADLGHVLVGLGALAFYAFCIATFLMQFVTAALVQATPRR